MEKILTEITPIFQDVLDNEDIQLTSETTAADIEEWDSLSHIQLIVAIEKHYKIKFTSIEISGFKNVGDMCGAIQQKIG